MQKEIFTTDESSMINDLGKAFDQNGLIAELMKEKEQLRKENLDLNRQVSIYMLFSGSYAKCYIVIGLI